MSSVIIKKIWGNHKGQDAVQKEMTKYWTKVFADEEIITTEEDIREYLGEEASKNTKN